MSDKPSQEQLDRWHSDPSNWRAFGFYFNPRDPRVWLPKRFPVMGWTLNFAHQQAWWWLIALLSLPLLLYFVAK